MIYFPNYTSKQCLDKDYLFTIIGAIRGGELKELIEEAKKKRSIYEEQNINEFIKIKEEIKKEIDATFYIKE